MSGAVGLRDGDLVDVVIRGARVYSPRDQEADPGTDFVTVEITTHDGSTQLVGIPEAPGVTVKRTAPAEWPPQPGDLWRDKHGALWFVYVVPRVEGEAPDLYMRTAVGFRWSAGFDGQLADNGPWALVHREPAAEGGEVK